MPVEPSTGLVVHLPGIVVELSLDQVPSAGSSAAGDVSCFVLFIAKTLVLYWSL
jgi:hypothetical protein